MFLKNKRCCYFCSVVLIFFVLACYKLDSRQPLVEGQDFRITVADLEKILDREKLRYPEGHFQEKTFFLNLKKRVLEDLVRRKLLLDEAIQNGTYVSEKEFEAELRKYKTHYTEMGFQQMLRERNFDYEAWAQLRRDNYVISKFLQESELFPQQVDEPRAQKFYQDHLSDFKIPESVHVRQIVTDSQEKAQLIIERLKKGENFAKLAGELSLSPDRKVGGDLGFIRKGNFPREFEVTFKMNPGEISPIIPSLYGFHIFKVLEHAEAKTLSFAEAKEKIIQTLVEADKKKALESLVLELKKKKHLQYHDDILTRISI